MSAVLWFILGSMFGGTVGIIMMCLVQISRSDEDENENERKEEIDNAKDS